MRARERTSLQDIVIAGESPMVYIWRCTAILLGGVVQVALACGHDGINLILEQPFVSFLCVLYIFWVYFIVPTFPPPLTSPCCVVFNAPVVAHISISTPSYARTVLTFLVNPAN